MGRLALNRTHCITCNTELVKGVNTVPNRVIYIQAKCRDCWNKYYNDQHKAVYDPAKDRDKQLRSKFGISLAEYTEMYNAQGGCCKICEHESDRTLHVDHSHTTGDIRGLLCHKCNHVLGLLNDDPMLVMKVYEYLRENER
jgi:hypothetical protein